MNTTRSTLALLAAAALLATQPGASCLSDGTADTSSSKNGKLEERVPSRAEIVKEGRGELNYTAEADGTVWVQDVREEATLATHRIHRGEKVRVVPEDDRVFLEGERINAGDIKRDNVHRIYLERDRRFEERDHDRDDRDVTKVPTGAELLGEGKGRTISATADRDGRVYVYDADDKKVVASVRVSEGDRFVFAPDDDRITVNGKRAVDRDFSTNTNYRVYQDR